MVNGLRGGHLRFACQGRSARPVSAPECVLVEKFTTHSAFVSCNKIVTSVCFLIKSYGPKETRELSSRGESLQPRLLLCSQLGREIRHVHAEFMYFLTIKDEAFKFVVA